MTDKTEAFINFYCDPKKGKFNQTLSAKLAGFSEHSAREIGYELMQKPEVREAIEKKLQARAKKTEVSTEALVLDLKRIKRRCMQATPVLDDEGNPTGEWRFDSKGALRSVELLGKTIGAFTDKIEHDLKGLEPLVIVTSREEIRIVPKS